MSIGWAGRGGAFGVLIHAFCSVSIARCERPWKRNDSKPNAISFSHSLSVWQKIPLWRSAASPYVNQRSIRFERGVPLFTIGSFPLSPSCRLNRPEKKLDLVVLKNCWTSSGNDLYCNWCTISGFNGHYRATNKSIVDFILFTFKLFQTQFEWKWHNFARFEEQKRFILFPDFFFNSETWCGIWFSLQLNLRCSLFDSPPLQLDLLSWAQSTSVTCHSVWKNTSDLCFQKIFTSENSL